MTDKNVPQLIEALDAFEDGIYIITKKFKGSIKVESVVNHGTIFKITLPLHCQ